MTTVRAMQATDLLKMNHINLDHFTENFSSAYYLNYLLSHGRYCKVAESFDGRLMGYIIGKAEGEDTEFHGHVTALSIAPEYRRLGVAYRLMQALESTSFDCDNANFVDLFVRPSNSAAVEMYKKMGYHIHRVIPNYYSSSVANLNALGSPLPTTTEDGFDMRKYKKEAK